MHNLTCACVCLAMPARRSACLSVCGWVAVISDPASPEAQKLEAALTALLQVGGQGWHSLMGPCVSALILLLIGSAWQLEASQGICLGSPCYCLLLDLERMILM